MYKSTNSGIDWSYLNWGIPYILRSVFFINPQTGWTTGYNNIYRTSDGGSTWTSAEVIPLGMYYSAHFANSLTGWAVGNSSIYKSTNGGVYWNSQYAGLSGLYSLYFVNDQTGWAVGDSSRILKTTNSGINWNIQSSPGSTGYNKVYFLNSETGWITGKSFSVRTYNGGTNWTFLSSGEGFTSCYFSNANTGWAVYGPCIKKTTNGGNTWDLQLYLSAAGFNDVFFTDTQTGWAVGGNLSSVSNGFIYRTSNGGINWVLQNNTTPPFQLTSVYFVNSQTGWTVGENGVILATTNGGSTYTRETETVIPSRHILFQNYPNPFNPITRIKFAISKNSPVTIRIFDILGRQIKELVNDYFKPGEYDIEFDASNLSSGIYFCLLTAGDFRDVNSMVLLK